MVVVVVVVVVLLLLLLLLYVSVFICCVNALVPYGISTSLWHLADLF